MSLSSLGPIAVWALWPRLLRFHTDIALYRDTLKSQCFLVFKQVLAPLWHSERVSSGRA